MLSRLELNRVGMCVAALLVLAAFVPLRVMSQTTTTHKKGEYTVKTTVYKSEDGRSSSTTESWTDPAGNRVKFIHSQHLVSEKGVTTDSNTTDVYDPTGAYTQTADETFRSGDTIRQTHSTAKYDANENQISGERTVTSKNRKTGEKVETRFVYDPEKHTWAPSRHGIAANGGSGWSATAASLFGHIGSRFAFQCPAGGTIYMVAGSGTYTDDSSVCSAAVHAGLIKVSSGGTVTIELRPGEDAYSASKQNGVESRTWGKWTRSFVFVP